MMSLSATALNWSTITYAEVRQIKLGYNDKDTRVKWCLYQHLSTNKKA